jgi:2,4-didehydro-3-deoxy-L-rhamnonate hydrolase
MRLYTFTTDGQQHLGVEKRRSGELIHLHAFEPAIPDSLLEFIRRGEEAFRLARQVLATNPLSSYRLAEIALEAPLPRPGKILCSGINYRSHQKENPNATMPEEPFFFAKMPSAVIGPGAPILHPSYAGQVDYEIEFAVVIGRPMSSTPEAEVMSHLFGYTILHDVSCREVQFRNNQVTLGKNFDSFCPLGPCVVTVDELVAPDRVGLRTYLNGELMQDGSTADWIFSLPKLLSFLSRVMTLEPGDIISTGTPSGVGLFRDPPRFMQPGDSVRLEAEGIGTLENPVQGPRNLSPGNASPS